MHARTRAYMHTHTQTSAHGHKHTPTRTHLHTYTHLHTCTLASERTHKYACIHGHTHVRTHARAPIRENSGNDSRVHLNMSNLSIFQQCVPSVHLFSCSGYGDYSPLSVLWMYDTRNYVDNLFIYLEITWSSGRVDSVERISRP